MAGPDPTCARSAWLLALACLLLLGPAVAHGNGPADDPNCEADLEALLDRLGHTDYARRAAAQEKLLELPPACQRELGGRYRAADDPEVRMRLRLFANQYFERQVLPEFEQLRRPGFLGISHTLQRLNQGTVVIGVVRVLPGTGAAKAGLKPGDQILALNGEPINPQNPVNGFSETIKARGEGATVKLKILRNGDKMNLQATLGPIPDHVDAQSKQIQRKIDRLRELWFQRAFLQGRLHFNQPPDLDQLLAEAGGEANPDAAQPRAAQQGVIIRGGQGNVRIRLQRLQIQQQNPGN